jgi:DNA-binding CsgD family transcriptional regulator
VTVRRSGESRRLLELAERLCASADLGQVLAGAHQHLARSLSADYAALGVSAPDDPSRYDWHVADIPEAFFRAYPEMVAHDFVRSAALARPGQVLTDEQVISRAALHRNPLYVRARELGVRLERVLAVMLQPGAPWHGGFILYRDGRLSFSEQERRELQRAVPLLTGAVRTSQVLHRAEARGQLFESLLRIRGGEVLLVDGRGRELWRTAGLGGLLLRHFAPTQVWVGPLPGVLADRLARMLEEEPPRVSGHTAWGSLAAGFVRLPPGRSWAVVLEDLMPVRWRSALTPREVDVVAGVLHGWDNRVIAAETGCSPETVKKHLKSAFLKLCVPTRAKLIALARDER